jgi:hypothetical protein
MRIISKKRDYYDCIQQYGQDQTRIYVRKEIEVQATSDGWKCSEGDVFNSKLWGQLLEDTRQRLNFQFQGRDYISGCHIIGFCGKIYPCIEIYYLDQQKLKSFKNKYSNEYYNKSSFYTSFFAYTFEQLYEFLSKDSAAKKNIDKDVRRYNPNYTFRNDFGYLKHHLLSPYFNRDKYSQIFVDNNIPIFIIKDDGRKWSYRYNNILFNPSDLHKYKFQKVFGPYEAYQELEMYISNVLKLHEPVTIEVSEKDRLSKHGFDKWSFRKSSSKRK